MAKGTKKDFLNPFKEGVTYPKFIEEIGNKSISEYLKGELSKEEIEFIEIEVEQFKKNKK